MGFLCVDRERLWHSHMEMARIGALPNGGCRRLALSEEDRLGRELFVRWCREAGCSIRIDAAGNIFARRAGRDNTLPAVATGSHLDTQPHGGKFDGIYGVLAGLEVFRTLNDAGIKTAAPLETIVWTNEESIRFLPPGSGSTVFSEQLAVADLHKETTVDGTTVREDLQRCGYLGEDLTISGHPLRCFIEAHIEQGPVLEQEGLTIGVVTGIQGSALYTVEVEGMDGHAGTVPMAMRRDALVGTAKMLCWLNEFALESGPDIRLTVGHIEIEPNGTSTIPGLALFHIEVRHPDRDVLVQTGCRIDEHLNAIAAASQLKITVKKSYEMSPVSFAPDLLGLIEAQADRMNYPSKRMLSGAGHDAGCLAQVTPTAMIFVPCEGGISHNEAENARPEDLAAGGNVLLHSLLACADEVSMRATLPCATGERTNTA